MRELLGKVRGWLSRNIEGDRLDPDYGTALERDDDSSARGEKAEGTLGEDLVWRAEVIDKVKEAAEAFADVLKNPNEPHPIDIPGEVGSGVLGFLRGVLVRVLVHVIAAPEREDQSEKRP